MDNKSEVDWLNLSEDERDDAETDLAIKVEKMIASNCKLRPAGVINSAFMTIREPLITEIAQLRADKAELVEALRNTLIYAFTDIPKDGLIEVNSLIAKHKEV